MMLPPLLAVCPGEMEWGGSGKLQRAETSCQLGAACPSQPWPLPGVTLLRAKPLGLVSRTLGLGQPGGSPNSGPRRQCLGQHRVSIDPYLGLPPGHLSSSLL